MVLCLLLLVSLLLQGQWQLWRQVGGVQWHLLLLLQAVLAKRALQVERQGYLCSQWGLRWSCMTQWELHICLGLQPLWLHLGRQPGLLLLLQVHLGLSL